MTNYTANFDALFSSTEGWDMIGVIFDVLNVQTNELFWTFIIILPFIMAWIKQSSVTIPIVLSSMLGAIIFVSIAPSAITIVHTLLIIAVAGTIYSIFKS